MLTKNRVDRNGHHSVFSRGTHDWETPQPADAQNKTVSYGIHMGRYPIGGMLVGDARRVLQKLINIDENSVAVINGSRVDESEQITEHVTTLSFVKPSSMKG